MWKDFKAFALKGNVLDLAIAVIIGGAFGKIVESLVDDIVMPIVGFLLGDIHLQYMRVPIGEVSIHYGAFIQASIDFLIITFSIFIFLQLIFRLRGKSNKTQFQKETSDQILAEIRDIIKEEQRGNKPIDSTPQVFISRKKVK
ncbi:large conductance mechanosensitive channel protein MscL [Pontibacillus salicampi]|uniref:Large-conductance mechanosensitive channel n=1 Tax=Pontibacillus salicampi TaxID=1449801 RepID=A0ABV6LNP1_9BACI